MSTVLTDRRRAHAERVRELREELQDARRRCDTADAGPVMVTFGACPPCLATESPEAGG